MSIADPRPTEPKPSVRWWHLTPGRLLATMLAVEALLWLSECFCWLPWHKGYAVLTAVAGVGAAIVGMVLWFAVALVFRRQFQFSLRSLLLLVVVVALPCSWLGVEMKKARNQRDAYDKVIQLGSYYYEFENLADPTPKWLVELLGERFFVDVEDIGIPIGAEISDDDLVCLDRLPKLKLLAISYSQITDSGLQHLDRLHELQELFAPGCGITDEGLRHLQGLAKLKSLTLTHNWDITDAGLEHVKGLVNLQTLELRGIKVSDAGLERLKGLTRLEKLDVRGTMVTDAGVAKLQQALPNCKITR